MKFYFILLVIVKWTCSLVYAAKKEAIPLTDGTTIRITETKNESGTTFELLRTQKNGDEERIWTYLDDNMGKSKLHWCVLQAADGSAEDLVVLLQMAESGYKVIQYNYGTRKLHDITLYAEELSYHKLKTEGKWCVAVPDKLILVSPTGETLTMTVAPDGQLTFRDGSPANKFKSGVIRGGKWEFLDPKKAALADHAFDRPWDSPVAPASFGKAESAPAPLPSSLDKSRLWIIWGAAGLLVLGLLWHGFRRWKVTK